MSTFSSSVTCSRSRWTITVIASQGLISAVFSLTRQAVQLGLSPRLGVVHTSSDEIGQIYLPALNWVLMLACINDHPVAEARHGAVA